MSVSQAILVGWNSKDFARRWGSSFGVSGAGLPVHEDGSLTFPYGPQGLREGHKNSWLQTYNSTSHAWWDHKNYHPEFPDKNGAVKVHYAPGWDSLLPKTATSVDAGLQCPMCGDSKSSQVPRY
eukprot:CAMPEP_0184301498 /NCGR_PEP_ID=MMETSP1049-20130417/11684_1 /TAXON_ID=77928 /ORGANISM="Proteomonas sulcata, Strain CCMP704" /LENGTH=123 /DNA_ID=CAMNT_0026612515 /DNA_START=526 /DNA_END=897 /DNA_ORIENTATION=+